MMSVGGCGTGNRGNAVLRVEELDKGFFVSSLGFSEVSKKTSHTVSYSCSIPVMSFWNI